MVSHIQDIDLPFVLLAVSVFYDLFLPLDKYHTDLSKLASRLHREADNARGKKKHRSLQTVPTQYVVVLLGNDYSVSKALLDENSSQPSDNETH